MGHALMWMESVATGLLFTAWVAACAARWRGAALRFGVPLLAALVVVGPALALTWGVGLLRDVGRVQRGLFVYALGWALALVIGVVIVLWRGWQRRAPDEQSAAAMWPRGRLVLALAAALILHAITISNMDLAVKVQLAALRAESGAKILALMPPRVLDRDNAAPIYQEAFAALTPADRLPAGWAQSLDRWLDLKTPLDPVERELADFLRNQEAGLRLLRQAAALPGCSFERDWFQSADLLVPELKHLRAGANALAVSARWHAAKGDAAAALADVSAMLGIARHSNDPILISLISSGVTTRHAVAILEDVLARTKPAAADLARFPLRDVAYGREVQRNIQMEEASLGILMILATTTPAEGIGSKWLEDEVSPAGLWVLNSPLYRIFFLADDLGAYRRHMRTYQQNAARPYAEARADWQKHDEAIKAEMGGGILSGLLLPAADRVAVAAARTDAAYRLAQAALAVETYRSKHGKLPARPEDLEPAARLPVDPFSGAPLRWRRAAAGLVLYSVGPDAVDNGGAALADDEKTGDIVFRLADR